MTDAARDKLVENFKSLLASGKYSDFIITCGRDTYDVHKAVVCASSGFFERAERFPRENGDSRTKVDLPEDEPTIVKLLIQYLYQGTYDLLGITPGAVPTPVVTGAKDSDYNYDFPHSCAPGCPRPHHLICHHHQCHIQSCGETCVDFVCKECCPDWSPTPPVSDPNMLLNAKMYEIGDKYDVVGLKELSREHFSSLCQSNWDSDDFAAAAHHAFSTTPDADKGLRDIVSQTIADHMALLKKPAIEALLEEYNGLSLSIMKLRAEELGWLK